MQMVTLTRTYRATYHPGDPRDPSFTPRWTLVR